MKVRVSLVTRPEKKSEWRLLMNVAGSWILYAKIASISASVFSGLFGQVRS
jgi:hypothetical protein